MSPAIGGDAEAGWRRSGVTMGIGGDGDSEGDPIGLPLAPGNGAPAAAAVVGPRGFGGVWPARKAQADVADLIPIG